MAISAPFWGLIADRYGRKPMVLRAMFAKYTRAQVIAACEKAGLSYAPITRPQDLFDDPHVTSPGALVEITLADGRTTGVPALPP